MPRLQPGDEIRVIAPSQSGNKRHESNYAKVQARLEAAGFRVTFSEYAREQRLQGAAWPAERAADFTAAFADPSVKAIFALRGGWAANDILPFVDWAVVRANPKPLIGYSDITVLLNAVLAKGKGPVFLGPTFSSLNDRQFGSYILNNLLAVLSGEPVHLPRNTRWSEPRQRATRRAMPWNVVQPGTGEGVLLGGNLGTFYLGQGTPYLAPFDCDFILAIEDDDEAGKYTAREFSRRLESILQQPGARKYLRGLLIGRFLPGSRFGPKELAAVLASKQLQGIPIVAELEFGHTVPNWTLPLGGTAKITARGNKAEIIVQA